MALVAVMALAELADSSVELHTFRAVLAVRQPWLDPLMRGVTFLGGPAFLFGLCLAVWLGTGRGSPMGVLLGASAANILMKAWFVRPRPGLDFEPLVQEPMSSFPSGHAMISFCVYGYLSDLAPPRWRPLLWTLILLVGLSRVYLGAHYPGDVAGGFAAGAPILWLALALRRRNTRAGG